ncbi:MAG: hypothetical protein ACRCYR_17800, partial [Phycicoccus sp.]
MRSETDQVFANPDGTLTREQSLEPVRVRRGASWLDVDSTLVRGPDGSWGPRVGATPLAFSGGGSAPLVSMTERGVRLGLSWPTALPTPTATGNELTYAEVFPGVDLRMAAEGTTFTQRLVVKTRAAGANPSVRALTLRAQVAGGTVATSGPGYVVKDQDGATVMTGSQPLMWDSAASTRSASTTEDLEDGDRQAAMGLSVSRTSTGSSMALSANAALLDDPATVFPVVLDPTTSPRLDRWTMVHKTYPTVSYYNFTNSDEGVGYNNWEGVNGKRIYYVFDTSAYRGKTVVSATLQAFETFSYSCGAGTVNAYLTEEIWPSTTWNTQPAKITGVLSGWSVKAGRPDCYPGGKAAAWNVTNGVKNRVSVNATFSTFVLQGASETTTSSWMRFGGPKNANSSYRPKLSVTYNTTPSTTPLTGMWVPTTSRVCSSSSVNAPVINPAAGVSESMYARISDADGGNLTSELEMTRWDNRAVSLTKFAARASNSVVSVVVPTKDAGGATLVTGTYRFRVRAADSYGFGAWSAYCYFKIDMVAPVVDIASPTWPEGVLAPQEATAGSFVMTSVGSSRISYRWNSAPTASSSVPDANGQVSVSTTTGRTLDYWHALAHDSAGNASYTDYYYVKRTQPGKLAQYLFNGTEANSPTQWADTRTSQLDGAPLSDPDAAYSFDIDRSFDSFTAPGRFDGVAGSQAAAFDGSGATARVPSRPVVSERSFTIGAWVFMSDRAQSRTVVSQLLDAVPADPAAPRIAFDLGYDVTLDKFTARVMNASGTVVGQAVDALPAKVRNDPAQADLTRDGSWVYLAMVYDATAGTLRLDTNHIANSNPLSSPFSTLYRGASVATS